MLEAVVLKEWGLDPLKVLWSWPEDLLVAMVGARNRRVEREQEAMEEARNHE